MARYDTRKALHWSAFFVAWLFCAAPVLADVCAIPAGVRSASIKTVIDGDTLELSDGRRVRLIGIDTPEIGRRGEPSEPFAEAARDRLRDLAGHQVQLVEGVEAKDRYGRTLAHLFDAEGHNIEARLLREGLGFALAVPPNVALVDCHVAAEAQARRASLGVWQESPVVQASQLRTGGFSLVRGRIRDVRRAGRYLWFETDGELVLRIEPETFAGFDMGPPESLRGRTVVARGWVIDRRRQGSVKAGFKPFMLPVRHPMMLEVE
jgi:endonuclease YncB( thermonuclease family)